MEIQRFIRGFPPRSPRVSFLFHVTSTCEALKERWGIWKFRKGRREGPQLPSPAWEALLLLSPHCSAPFPETLPSLAAICKHTARPLWPRSPAVAIGTLVKDKLNLVFYKMVLWTQNKI